MDRTIELLKESNALLEGHFLLSSGKHSNKYVQCAKLIQNPAYCEEISKIIANEVKKLNLEVDLCVGPALGGVIISYELARALGVDAIFSERLEGKMTLRRGFTVEKGQKILVVEDVITTGKSSFETIEVLEELGAEVVGLAAIVNRSDVDELHGLPIASASKIHIDTWDPEDIPEDLKDIPLVKPGSRITVE